MIASRLTPASTRTMPVLEVDLVKPASEVGVEHRAAGVLRRVAVAATEPAGDQPAPPGPGEQAVDRGLVGRVDDRWRQSGAVRPHPVRSSIAFVVTGTSATDTRART